MEKKQYGVHGIGFKLIISFIIASLLLLGAMEYLITSVLQSQEQKLMTSKEKSDIQLMEELIGEGDWHVRDGYLMKGKVIIGNGTKETANLRPFLETEARTGTFCYTFMKTPDDGINGEGLKWVGDEKTGYMQGHYIRVSGSTLSPLGDSIVGTYMDKKVADVIDNLGYYSGEANVTGGMIYCYYESIYDPNGKVIGCIVVGRNIDELKQEVKRASASVNFLVIVSILIAMIGVYVVLKHSFKSIEDIEDYLEIIGKGTFPDEPLVIKNKDEIGDIATSINAMVVSLKESERIGAELDVARQIQRDFLPKLYPSFPARDDMDIYASMEAAKEVGGDFYDFFFIDDSHIALVVGDVSGKGVPAALFMMTAKTLLKSLATSGLPVNEVMRRANNELCSNNEAGMFVTCWMGIVDLNTGDIVYTCGGHNPPLIKRGENGYEYLKGKVNLVLAGMEDMSYDVNEAHLDPDDMIFIYTDGVTEAQDLKPDLYGEERLQNVINQNKPDTPERLCTLVKTDIKAFVKDAEQFDDITMLAFKYNGRK